MKDQHEKISGYRDLTQEEIDQMNECKDLEKEVKALIQKLRDSDTYDQRWVAIAETHFDQGFMAAVRSVARPI